MNSILSALSQFNAVDVFFIILSYRIISIALKNGFVAEFFKLLSILLVIYVAMHYYTAFSDFLSDRLGLDKKMPLEFLDFFCFIVLTAAAYLAGVFLRLVFFRFMNLEAAPVLNKWLGLILGLVRIVFLSSFIAFSLSISTINYLHEKVDDSYFGKKVLKIAPATYSGIWYGLMSKFMKNEKFNKTVLEVQKDSGS